MGGGGVEEGRDAAESRGLAERGVEWQRWGCGLSLMDGLPSHPLEGGVPEGRQRHPMDVPEVPRPALPSHQ